MAELQPIFVSVKQAAVLLGLTTWSVYKLCDDGKVESRYHGKRRLVVLASVQEYAAGLPDTPDVA